MRHAEAEMDVNEGSSDSENDFTESAGEMSSDGSISDEDMKSAEDEEDGAKQSDEDQQSSDENESISEATSLKLKRSSQHLPDHLFTSAFKSRSPKPLASTPRKSDIVKKRQHRARAKDLIVGCVYIRSRLFVSFFFKSCSM
jgi:hypothetical protein